MDTMIPLLPCSDLGSTHGGCALGRGIGRASLGWKERHTNHNRCYVKVCWQYAEDISAGSNAPTRRIDQLVLLIQTTRLPKRKHAGSGNISPFWNYLNRCNFVPLSRCEEHWDGLLSGVSNQRQRLTTTSNEISTNPRRIKTNTHQEA